MLNLVLRSEETSEAWRVWPEAEEIPSGKIHENGRYVFELDGEAAAAEADLLIDDVPLEALRTSSAMTARWRWAPGFHAGTTDAELRLPDRRPRRFEVVTDPDLRKLTRDDFDCMVRELLEDSFALFSISGFRKSVARGTGSRPPAIARLEFIRSRIAELETVVDLIVRKPRRLLKSEEVAVPYYRARRTNGPEILRSFQSGRIGRETSLPPRLPPALQGFLPKQLRVRVRRNSLDTPEHRQMGACLRTWAEWLTGAADQLERIRRTADSELNRGVAVWIDRCRHLSQRVSLLASAEPFAEAAEAPPRLMLSALFRNDPVYRRFYRIWQDMNLGIAAIFGDFLNLPLARTFELYELWCFLRLVRAAAETFGEDEIDIRDLFVSNAAGGVTIASGAAVVQVGDGWTLCFQKQYREFWVEEGGRGSYSRTMTPDVVAAREEGSPAVTGRMIVLDAKYRIGDGLNAALNSIHTYRDALVQETASGSVAGIVSAAYLLSPYVPALGENYEETALPGRLFHPSYRAGFRFGAVTLRPGMGPAELAAALRLIVEDATASDRA